MPVSTSVAMFSASCSVFSFSAKALQRKSIRSRAVVVSAGLSLGMAFLLNCGNGIGFAGLQRRIVFDNMGSMQPVSDKQALTHIAANLKRLRIAKGLSMAKLAKEIGDYPTSIKRIEDAESMPGVGLLTRICEALGVTANDMLTSPKEFSQAS